MYEFKKKIFSKFEGKCAYCGNEITIDNMTVDHIRPKSKGGSLSTFNCYPACSRCNTLKGDGTVEDLRNKIKYSLNQLKKSKEYQIARKYKLVSSLDEEVVFYFEKV